MTVQDRVRRFILDDIRWGGSPDDLTEDRPLITGGIIDSLGVFELIGMLETEYGLTVGDDEVLPENLGSLGAIAAFVSAKRAVCP